MVWVGGPAAVFFFDWRGLIRAFCGAQMKRRHQHKCPHCKEFYVADPRNRYHQRYCSKPACRKASKAESQRRWFSKQENQNYFRGEENTRRVQEWRKAHPGYWRRKKSQAPDALQDLCEAQVAVHEEIIAPSPLAALQEVFQTQPAVVVGLIATMTGSALQEDILVTARSLIRKGCEILGVNPRISAAAMSATHRSDTQGKALAPKGIAAVTGSGLG